MTTAPVPISTLPSPPNQDDRSTFNARAYAWNLAVAQMTGQINAIASGVKSNADEAVSAAESALEYALRAEDAYNVWNDAANFSLSQATSYPLNAMGQAVVTLSDGRVLVAGGQNLTLGSKTAQCYIYSGLTNSWSVVAPLPVAMYGQTAVRLLDGRIMLLGGYTDSGYNTNVYLYNPAMNSWATAGVVSAPNFVGGRAAILGDGRVLFCLYTYSAGTSTTCLIYDPSTSTFSPAAALASPNNYSAFSMAPLPDGRVLLCGGSTYPYASVKKSYIYDGVSNTWTNAPDMPSVRFAHAISPLSDGRIFVVGGYEANVGPVASALIYNPVANAWTQLPASANLPPTVPESAQATPLSSGRTLVILGNQGGGRVYIYSRSAS